MKSQRLRSRKIKDSWPEPVQDQVKALAGLLAGGERFLLLAHSSPDGDTLGSVLALGQGLRSLGKKVTMFSQDGVPAIYEFLPGAEEMAASTGEPEDYDLVVMLDFHDLERAGDNLSRLGQVPILAAVDHHLVNGSLPEAILMDNKASAAGELVYRLLLDLNAEITPPMAINLFVAISTDTGSFSFNNTTPRSLETAAALVRAGASPWAAFQQLHLNRSYNRLKLLSLSLAGLELFYEDRVAVMPVTLEMMKQADATSIDADGFVEFPRSIRGVEVIVLIRENDHNECKVSLRSKDRFNSGVLAMQFGGGGHPQAAGFTLAGPLAKVKSKVLQAIASLLPPEHGRPR